MIIKNNSWHFKYYKKLYKDYPPYHRTLCGYIWSILFMTLGSIISYPTFLLGYIFKPLYTKVPIWKDVYNPKEFGFGIIIVLYFIFSTVVTWLLILNKIYPILNNRLIDAFYNYGPIMGVIIFPGILVNITILLMIIGGIIYFIKVKTCPLVQYEQK